MPKSKVGRFGPDVFSLIRAEVVRGEARGVGCEGGGGGYVVACSVP